MLEKYRERVESLPRESRALLSEALSRSRGITIHEEGSLFDTLAQYRVDQADLVMSLAHRSDAHSVAVVQHLLGTPITVVPQGEVAIDPVTNRHKTRTEPRPRSQQRRVDNRRVLSVSPNPKKPGSASHDRYALWQEGATVTELLARGLTSADVSHDTKRGFVKLSDG